MDMTAQNLDLVFGTHSKGATAEVRAKTSDKVFVFTQDELAILREGATGRRVSAWEALQAFGFEKLYEASMHTSAILVTDFRRPASLLRERRKQLGLLVGELAHRINIPIEQIQNAESIKTRTPMRVLERIARALGLEETKLVDTKNQSGDQGLAVRLRHLKSERPEFTANTVLTFDEAAWVISKQEMLRSWLTQAQRPIVQFGFETDSRYGDAQYPAWWQGYRLASATRQKLGLTSDQPILTLRKLVEETLGIPIVQARLPKGIAGATISNGDSRGIILNIEGDNQNVWVRRVTLAHELGHLLWDPDPVLSKLRIDLYQDFETQLFDAPDYVEARANAFAVEFLAPQEEIKKIYTSSGDTAHRTRNVMDRFGVSFTSVKYQLWNAFDRKVPLSDFRTDDIHPTDEWAGGESYSLDFFKPESVPETRRGFFSGLVVEAQKRGLITADSAASFLGCTDEEYRLHSSLIRDLYPFSSSSF